MYTIEYILENMNIKSVVDMLVLVASIVCYDSKISKAAITITIGSNRSWMPHNCTL